MKTRDLSIWFAVILGIAIGWRGNAQAGSGMINVISEDLPNARIMATGKGYSPNKNISPAQRRLLAKRAATIDAYRTLASTINGVSKYIKDGKGIIMSSGFVKGAEVSDVRYFANGKVEVCLVLPVGLASNKQRENINWDAIVFDIAESGYPVYYSEKPVRQISEEEWQKMQR